MTLPPLTPLQAYGKYIIFSANLLASVAMLSLALYFYYRSKKTPLLYSYLSIMGLLLIWTVSKVFKTVTPNVASRWVFVVIQYVGVQFLGFSILLFALLYAGYSFPRKKSLLLLLIHPVISFLAVLTNPLHYGFYAVFTYTRTRFGPLFLPSQFILYTYIIIGIVLLVRRSFDPLFHPRKKMISRSFALCAMLPLFVNFYYITFKFTDIPWIFPFRPFDVTPIAMALAFTLFAIPSIQYKFLDIVPLSYHHLYHHIEQGFILFDSQLQVVDINPLASKIFPQWTHRKNLLSLPLALDGDPQGEARDRLLDFIQQKDPALPPVLISHQGVDYKWRILSVGDQGFVLLVMDISHLVQLQRRLQASQDELAATHETLLQLTKKEKELALFRARSVVSQNVHDIVGHSLTVVMGTLELALLEQDSHGMNQRLQQAKELLLNNLSDLKNTFVNSPGSSIPNLVEAIQSLASASLVLDVSCQGTPYPLHPQQGEAVYRLCQEAVTNALHHGKAGTLHVFLRYYPESFEVYAIDDGCGCSLVQENLGLSGIRQRITALGGEVSFGAGEGSGFHIHGLLPVKPTSFCS